MTAKPKARTVRNKGRVLLKVACERDKLVLGNSLPQTHSLRDTIETLGDPENSYSKATMLNNGDIPAAVEAISCPENSSITTSFGSLFKEDLM